MKFLFVVFLSFSINVLATSLKIEKEGGYYKAWIRKTIASTETSSLYDLYKGLNSEEISMPTNEGLISRKVIFNNSRNLKFSCVLLDNFKTTRTRELICDMYIARFNNDNYEIYYYERPQKEIDMIFHDESATEMLVKLGFGNESLDINIDNKILISSAELTLNISIKE